MYHKLLFLGALIFLATFAILREVYDIYANYTYVFLILSLGCIIGRRVLVYKEKQRE
ncbi:hypothetical protein [Fulvivirga ligni]|uniref:hypothetical protein n=1 Tax=Fulvivirga ligni TaxID=2904246 RepID=UPI001F32A453|nr:hypothetical protein [Fulvivirga ligni]UII22714.1 hypothetical protein LVD16_05675 [Fulvivirga ligni]